MILSDSQKLRIERLLHEFDFERVHQVMKLLGWRWNDQLDSPTINELKACARRLLIIALNGRSPAKTGGFQSSFDDYDSEDEPILGLSFILCSSEENELGPYGESSD